MSERLRLPLPFGAQVPPLRLCADLAGAPLIEATAIDTVTLNTHGSVCLDGGCLQLMTVECPNMTMRTYTNQPVVVLITGPGPTYDINMLGLQQGLMCNVSVTITEGSGATDTVTASLKVWGS